MTPEQRLRYLQLKKKKGIAGSGQAQGSVSPPSFPETLSRGVSSFAQKTAEFPLTNPAVDILEKAGRYVQGAKEASVGNILDRPSNFPTARGVAMGTLETGLEFLPQLTPSSMATAIGGESLPVLAAPLARRADILRRSVGNKFIGTPLSSLKKSMREGTEQLGERFLKTELPANRDEAFVESSKMVDRFEKKIQAKMDQAVKSGKVAKPEVSGDEFDVAGKKLQEPIVLPSGGKPLRFTDDIPKKLKANEPRSPYGYEDPDALNLSTKGKKFTKGESRGLFNPESPDIEAKQIEYLKKERSDDILKAREAFRKRASDPEYGYGIGKKYAISRKEISNAIDTVSAEAKKTGFEKDTIEELGRLKDEFGKSHPEYADVQYWNDVKRAIYKRIGDKGYLAKNTTDKVSAMKEVASAIRSEIERVIPDIKDLNREQGLYLEIRNALGDTIASRSRNNVSGAVSGELKDEALVRAARRRFAQNLPNTRGTSLIGLPAINRD